MNEIEFIKSKIADMDRKLAARLEMQRVMRSGSEKEWKSVGCNMSKAERLKSADMHGRIAVKNRVELNIFKDVLNKLESLHRLQTVLPRDFPIQRKQK